MNRQRALAAAGLLVILLSAGVPGSSIEAALGRENGSLAWGPGLFRVLLALHGVVLMLLARQTVSCTSGGTPSQLPWRPLLVLTGVALALRAIRLDTCLWMDEIFAVTESIRAPLGAVVSSFPTQNQHMLYSLLARLSLGAFGESEWSVRLPAVFFGVGCVWSLFFLGRVLIGTREALLASTLMTVSYHGVWFSQNARGYTGLLFFTMLVTWLWIEASRRGRTWWVWYALAGAAGLWMHLTMAFVIATHALIEVARLIRGRGSWTALTSIALAGTLALQLYALSLPEFLRTGLGEVSLPSQWTSPLWAAAEAVRSLRAAFSGVAVVVAGGFVAAVGFVSIWRRSPAAGLAFIMPGIICGAAMIALGHNLWPRFFFFCMGFVLLIVIHGVFRAPALLRLSERWTERLGNGGAWLLIAASAITLPLCYRYPKQDFTGARDYVESRRRPEEAVTAAGLAAPAYRYYAPAWSEAQSDEAFDAVAERTEWLVYTLPPHLQAWQPRTWASIQRGFETVRIFPGTLGDGSVFVCRRRAKQ